MKKFLAGLLAAVSVLSLSAPAYAANSKTMTKQGELSYDVAVEMPEIVFNVALPSEMKVALNPFGNTFQLDELNTVRTNNGIVSVAYPMENYNKDYGFFLDATAITSTSTDRWFVVKDALTPGVKGANMAFLASQDEEGIAQYSNTNRAATSVSSQGNLVLDSTVQRDNEKGIARGQTSQTKVAYVPASADGTTPSKIYIGFTGKLAEDSDTTPVNWTENDVITVNLILRLTPGPKTLA